MSAKTHTPTADELADAVSTALDEYQKANPEGKVSSKEITSMIEGENPSWKVSTSKVSKRLRKEVKSRPADKGAIELDDDEVSLASQSSAAQKLRSMGQSMRKVSMTKKISSIFNRGAKSKTTKETPETMNIVVDVPETKSKNLLPDLNSPDAEAEAEVDLLASPAANDQATAELTVVEESSTEDKEPEKTEETKPPVPEPIAEAVETETPSEPVEGEKADSTVYQDDNDGSKEKCCESPCTIM